MFKGSKLSDQRTSSQSKYFAENEIEVEGSIGDRFGRQVEHYGDRIAVPSASGDLSYRELDRMTHQLSASLSEAGATVGDRVILLLVHDAPLIAGMIGVLRSGLVCVPLRTSQPVAILQAAVTRAKSSFMVCDAANGSCHQRIMVAVTNGQRRYKKGDIGFGKL